MEFEDLLKMEAAKETATRFPAMPKSDDLNWTKEVSKTSKQFDTRAVMADLKAMELKCDKLVSEANALMITTSTEKLDATNISGLLQELAKKVKKKCEDFLEPYKKVTSAINGPKKRITEAATKAKNIVNQKIIQQKRQEEIDQAKQQKLIDEQTAQLQEKLKAQAKELNIEVPKVAPIRAPKPVTIVRGDSGASVYTRSGWKVAIITPEDVEREYCLPSMKLLNQAVKMGKRKLAGCRVYKDETPVTRTG